jgi:hypothetical protein
MFFKISKKLFYSRTAEKKENLSAALEYDLLVNRNHFKILLDGVKGDFEEISNKYNFSNMFST